MTSWCANFEESKGFVFSLLNLESFFQNEFDFHWLNQTTWHWIKSTPSKQVWKQKVSTEKCLNDLELSRALAGKTFDKRRKLDVKEQKIFHLTRICASSIVLWFVKRNFNVCSRKSKRNKFYAFQMRVEFWDSAIKHFLQFHQIRHRFVCLLRAA